ncbi:MAG: hypothetical protein EXS55_01665 [Candidatus Magasanikbacteria bacterium]|nr:hypothetical protein [Candidatus Magasanikbacteria bacterium]
MEEFLQLNEFFVEGGQQNTSHVLLHITEPSTPEERAKGYFFAVCEINNADNDYIGELQKLVDQIENEYYATDENAEKNALEIVLEKINQENVGLLQKKPALHCIVGAVRQPDIIFSTCGSPELFLFYKNRQGLYQSMNLLENGETEPPERTQLFSQIIQGKISPGDYLFAGTKHIRDYFDNDRLQKIITTRPAKSSAEHLERVLGELRNGYSFGGLIIQVTAQCSLATNRKARPIAKENSATSLTGLFATEQNTASTLAPSIFGRLNQKIKKAVETSFETKTPPPSRIPKPEGSRPAEINATHRRAHEPSAAPRLKKPALKFDWGKILIYLKIGLMAVVKSLAWLLFVLWSVLQGLVRSVALLLFIISNYQNRRRNILEEWHRKWRALQDGFTRLPRFTQIIILGLAVVIIIFTGSLIHLRAAQTKRVAKNQFQNAINTIKTKKDSAESALIYKDTATALNNVREAEMLLASLTCNAKETAGACQSLRQDFLNLLTKIRKLITVPVETIITWKNLAPDSVIKINDTIVGFSSSTSKLAIYNLVTKEETALPTNDTITGFNEGSVPKENDYALLMFNHKQLLALDPKNNSVKILEVAYPTENINIQSAVVYNRKLYSLDTLNNQIYKHNSIKTGFGPGQAWVKDLNIDLKNGTDLSIDGDLFIIKNDNQITKLTAGISQPFTVQGLDPALGKGAKIWTYNDLNFIYVLDPLNKRVIILNKDGTLDHQLTANEFVNPTDMIIDESNNTGYIIDSGKLLKINLK